MSSKKFVLQPSHVSVYRFIENYITKNLYSPTFPEIAAGVNPKITVRHAGRIVDDLVEQKYLSKAAWQKRGLKINKPIEGGGKK